MREDLESLLKARRGHFALESGHHGDLWLDLESLCRTPRAVRRLAAELAQRLAPYRPEIVCGPLVEGALVGLLVASEMDLEFVYAEPRHNPEAQGLFPVSYQLPAGLRNLAGRRVAIVNDVINAGSAVRGTMLDLAQCSADVVAVGTLLALGETPAKRGHAQAAVNAAKIVVREVQARRGPLDWALYTVYNREPWATLRSRCADPSGRTHLILVLGARRWREIQPLE